MFEKDIKMEKVVKPVRLDENEIAVYWLGQAGFMIIDSSGRTLTIDPYLTDCCERFFGFKRLSPKLISPDELKTDILFVTHEHYDHFDIDAVPIIMSDSSVKFIGSAASVKKCLEMSIGESRLTCIKEAETVDLGWVKLHGVYADHGELSPDAIGVVVEISDVIVYYTGDYGLQAR